MLEEGIDTMHFEKSSCLLHIVLPPLRPYAYTIDFFDDPLRLVSIDADGKHVLTRPKRMLNRKLSIHFPNLSEVDITIIHIFWQPKLLSD